MNYCESTDKWVRKSENMPLVADCKTCANKGVVRGLSGESFCESCMHSVTWMRNYYNPVNSGQHDYEEWVLRDKRVSELKNTAAYFKEKGIEHYEAFEQCYEELKLKEEEVVTLKLQMQTLREALIALINENIRNRKLAKHTLFNVTKETLARKLLERTRTCTYGVRVMHCRFTQNTDDPTVNHPLCCDLKTGGVGFGEIRGW